MGLKSFAITSDGFAYPNHKFLATSQKKLTRLQRQLSRKSKGSKRREKARVKAAKLQEHIVNQRQDTLHTLSTRLIRDYDLICIEDLATKKYGQKSQAGPVNLRCLMERVPQAVGVQGGMV